MKTRWAISILVIGAALTLTACAAVIDSEGAKIGDPARFAEATHIAEMSQAAAQATAQAVSIEATRQTARIEAEATAAAITHAKQQAEADKVRAGAAIEQARAVTEQNAQGAALAGKSTLYLLGYAGLGVGGLVLAVGLAFGVVAWVNKRATSVYPDKRGQFPVIVRRGLGWVAFHDPNRALGPAAVVRTPTALDALAGVAVATVRALREGNTPSLPTAEPAAAFPLPGSEAALLQIATQEQAAQVRVAEQSGRPKFMLTVSTPEQPTTRQSAARGRMPAITMINDPAQIERFERKLLTDGDE